MTQYLLPLHPNRFKRSKRQREHLHTQTHSAMTQPLSPERSLKVAIIGGGPAGLAAAIALSKLPSVDWKLYEKKPEISEIGNGISIQPNTWRMLEKLGASRHLKNDDFFRPLDGHFLQHR